MSLVPSKPSCPVVLPDPLDVQTSEINVRDSHGIREVFFAASNLNQVYCSEHSQLNVFEHASAPSNDGPEPADDPLLQAALLKTLADTKKPTAPPVEVTPKRIDYNAMKPYFLHVDVDKIRKTFQRTTQFATNVMSGHRIQQTIQSPYPAHNVWRRNEPVASDTIYSETAAVCH